MYAVEVRDHIMIAHSLPAAGLRPGPAAARRDLRRRRRLLRRGARRARHRRRHRARDRGARRGAGAAALPQPRRRCPEFAGRFTTTEVLCRHVFDALAAAARDGAARRRRAAAAAAGDPAREPRGARLVRGATSGERRAFRDPGPARHADRRLRLRPAADRGAAGGRAGTCGTCRCRAASRSRTPRAPARRRGGAGGAAGRGGGAGRRARLRGAAGRRSRRRRGGCGWSRSCTTRSATRAGSATADRRRLLGARGGGARHARARWSAPARRPARRLADGFGVPPERITVAPPGTDPAPRAAGGGRPAADPQRRLADPAQAPRRAGRGARAAARPAPGGRGSSARPTLDPACAAALARAGGRRRASATGSRWSARSPTPGPSSPRADVFALASEYEGYGMAFAEALSQGLPVVACRAGAIADLVPEAAGALVPPGDVGGLRGGARRRSSTTRPAGGPRPRRPGPPGRRCRAGPTPRRASRARCDRAAGVSFDAAWLDLREPADRAARDPGCSRRRRASRRRRRRRWRSTSAAAPAPRCAPSARGAGARWRLVDRDPALLAARRGALPRRRDRRGRPRRSRPRCRSTGVRLVTASALLDLASRDWIEALAARLAAAGARRLCRAQLRRARWTGTRRCRDDAAVRRGLQRAPAARQGPRPGARPGRAPRRSAAALGGARLRGADRAEPVAARARAGGAAGGARRGDRRGGGRGGLRGGAGLGSGAARGERLARCTVGHVDVLALPAGASAQSKTTSESSP